MHLLWRRGQPPDGTRTKFTAQWLGTDEDGTQHYVLTLNRDEGVQEINLTLEEAAVVAYLMNHILISHIGIPYHARYGDKPDEQKVVASYAKDWAPVDIDASQA